MLPAMSKNKGIGKTNMIKTLRITSIIAAVLAVIFFVLPVVFGVRSDEQTEQFLNSVSAIEEFKKAKGKQNTKSESQISPLVKQAEAFALYLNPPKPTKPPATARETVRPMITPRPTGSVSPKFDLIGTSYYALHPELSLALIDEPGKGLRWVRQSSEVGHLIIEQVKDGSVAVRDGKRTFNLVAERPKKRNLLKEPLSGTTGSKSILPTSAQADSRIKRSRPPQAIAKKRAATAAGKAGARPIRSKLPQMSREEQEALAEKIFAELEAMQAAIEANQPYSEPNGQEIAAPRTNFISRLEAMRISAEEAKRLDHLGKKLKDIIKQDANQAEEDRTERDANSSEPNFGDPNFSEPNFGDPNFDDPNSPEEE